jgi:hypothetical protein
MKGVFFPIKMMYTIFLLYKTGQRECKDQSDCGCTYKIDEGWPGSEPCALSSHIHASCKSEGLTKASKEHNKSNKPLKCTACTRLRRHHRRILLTIFRTRISALTLSGLPWMQPRRWTSPPLCAVHRRDAAMPHHRNPL